MDAPAGIAALPAALDQWRRFLSLAIAKRLDPDNFEAYVPLLLSKHPLPPTLVADLLLRPSTSNKDSLDPRVPQYLQVLLSLRCVNITSILVALYRYSTLHAQSQMDIPDANAANNRLRWRNSYSSEEVIFYRLTKAVAHGSGIKTEKEALETAKVMAKWMALFSAASASFGADVMGALHSSQAKDEMESARAALVMLLLGVCENQMVLNALGRPLGAGT
jgi:mediator of RNA polymerase II transcription subunit 5